ncbi:hypothetical protein F1325_13150 [Proteus columbae]|uniref:Uncharacterized protein n=1 Tax=Proteus columbae TaxID=1987580 RepID=A0A6I7DCK9_9GAMM|nr:hypothetical protein F1325_13150 [Proteus columbae]
MWAQNQIPISYQNLGIWSNQCFCLLIYQYKWRHSLININKIHKHFIPEGAKCCFKSTIIYH